jgi:hypothetical protein
MKEKIIEIIGSVMEPERAECKADEILNVFNTEMNAIELSIIQLLENRIEVIQNEPHGIVRETMISSLLENIEINPLGDTHHEAMIDCCNDLLDCVDEGLRPSRQLTGLRILLNRNR